MDIRLKSPSIFLLVGSTSSGKSTWINRLIINSQILINPAPKQIVFCYAENQPLYDELKTSSPVPIKFYFGLSDDLYETLIPGTLLIADDLLQTINKELLLSIVNRGSHHKGISIVIVAHNLFDKSLRSISLQCHYLILMKTVRDFNQIQFLGRQLNIGSKEFLKLFKVATREPYSYLFIDLRPETDNLLRYRTNIFQDPSIVYVTRDNNDNGS